MEVWRNTKMVRDMNIFNFLKPQATKKAAVSEIDILRKQIELADAILNDYRSSPQKYQRLIKESTADAYAQMVIDKTKLEMRYLFLTKFINS